MSFQKFSVTFAAVLCFSSVALADAPLKTKLDLNNEQAKKVQLIQKEHRRPFASKRQELHKERRKLRRARNANDSKTVQQLEATTIKLQTELNQIRTSENDEIRKVLTGNQLMQFEKVLQQRKEMVGSSRDAREIK